MDFSSFWFQAQNFKVQPTDSLAPLSVFTICCAQKRACFLSYPSPLVRVLLLLVFLHMPVSRNRRVLCNGDRFRGVVWPPPPHLSPPGFGLTKFSVWKDHPHPHPLVLDLENFLSWGTPPPLSWEICWEMQIWSRKMNEYTITCIFTSVEHTSQLWHGMCLHRQVILFGGGGCYLV